MKMSIPCSSSSSSRQQQQQADNDRSSGELRALDCNLSSLCDHIQSEGFNSGSFYDIVVKVMDSTYHLHRLILSRSSYFSIMLQGPWKEAHEHELDLHVDDDNINSEAMEMALAYIYGHHPKLNDDNAFRVLAAASFLDLQDLCAICTDFIISELWTSNFLAYQVFAESHDYGIYGERVKNACWGYLCQSAAMELKEVLPKLSSQTLHALLTSDQLWVKSEEDRFNLALYTLRAKGTFLKVEHPEEGTSGPEMGTGAHADCSGVGSKHLTDSNLGEQIVESSVATVSLRDDNESRKAAHNILVELADCVVDLHSGVSNPKSQVQQASCSESKMESCKMEQPTSLSKTISNLNGSSCGYAETPNAVDPNRMEVNALDAEGSCEESTWHRNSNGWDLMDQSRQCSSAPGSCEGFMPNEWVRCGMPSPSRGGRTVGRRQVKSYAKGNCGVSGEEYDTFLDIFEGGSLLYCNMSFEALLDVRKQLEELGFPCKALNEGLWLQMLLSYRLQEIVADTCKNCCLTSMACACRNAYGFSQGAMATDYYMQDQDRNNNSYGNMGNVYISDSAQEEGNGLTRPARVHVRGPIDGLAGIGRGTTFVPAPAWPPTRFVFSRVPFGLGNRNCQQSLATDESEPRADLSGDLSGDGLTALVGLSQGGNNVSVHGQQSDRGYEPDLHNRSAGSSVSGPSTRGIPVSDSIGVEWEGADGSSISLDTNAPLRHFPPFRFGVEFEDVYRLSDGQVKSSPEVFYAGSIWKVSAQAFNDEDPQGRRTLGLFLHRRKALPADLRGKVPMYLDSREKVTVRYKLICPSKREVMPFGKFNHTGTLLPKAPRGWGWRTALLFDELGDLLQGGALRVAAVVQLV